MAEANSVGALGAGQTAITLPVMPEFDAAFGESFAQTLDLDTWTLGGDLLESYARLEQEIAEAIAQETDRRKAVREVVFSKLKGRPGAPRNAGLYQAQRAELERVHRGLLFNGGVEACDGISVVHDTIPLSITQIGVCLVSYNGEQGSWSHRLYRRDLRSRMKDPVEEVLTLLDEREKPRITGAGGERDQRVGPARHHDLCGAGDSAAQVDSTLAYGPW